MEAEIRIFLVDDEVEIRRSIRDMLSGYGEFQVVGEADGKESALALLARRPAHVVFSDIQMAGGSGFDLAQAVHSRWPEVLVVFLTGYADFALEGYVYGPVDFLVKPVSRQRLEQTLERIHQRLRQRPETAARIGMPTEGGYRIVDPAEIAYLEKDERRVKINWKDGAFDHTGKSMQELEEILLDCGFFRCHQSYLIPLGDITGIEKEHFGRSYRVRLRGDPPAGLPLSRKKYYELRDLLRQRGIAQLE